MHYLHFVSNYFSFSSVFFIRATNIDILNLDVFKPFNYLVWICSVVTFLLFGQMLKIFFNFDKTIKDEMSTHLITLGALCQQGAHISVDSLSSRCIIISLLFASLLLYNFYTSVSVSMIVQRKYETNIKTKEDLANSDVDVGFLDSFTMRFFLNVSWIAPFDSSCGCMMYFQGTTAEEYVDFVQKKVTRTGREFNSFFMSPYEGLHKVKNERFAFYCEESTAWIVIGKIFEPHEICATRQIYFRQKQSFGIIVRKHSPFRKRLLINFLKMSEIGIVRKIWQKWNPGKPQCTSSGHFESVRWEYSSTCFIILFLSFIISIIIFTIELYLIRRNRKRINTVVGI